MPQNVHLGCCAMVPLLKLFLEFFHQLVFPCRQTCSSDLEYSGTHGTIPTSLLVFVESVFTSLVSLLFLECKLHCGKSSPEVLEVMHRTVLQDTCSLALKAS